MHYALSILVLIACGASPVEPAAPAAAPAVADPDVRRKELQGLVRAYVAELGRAGRYDCCVKVPCTQCALLAAGCACGEGLRRGEPVCEECAYLWMRGQGDEPGVRQDQVRSFLEANRGQAAPAGCACAEDASRVVE